jgi:hypothetical protein
MQPLHQAVHTHGTHIARNRDKGPHLPVQATSTMDLTSEQGYADDFVVIDQGSHADWKRCGASGFRTSGDWAWVHLRSTVYLP